MSYTIRDIDKALVAKIEAKNFTVFTEGKNIRVKTLMGTPDELIAQKHYPCVLIESGYMIRTPESWQKLDTVEYAAAGSYVSQYVCSFRDVFYTYKVGFYVNYKPHCTYLEAEFLKLFPNKFYCAITDSSGYGYTVPFVTEGALVNLDESKGLARLDRALRPTEKDSDVRLFRRDIIMTTQLMLEDSRVEELLRPWAGMQFNVDMAYSSTASTATVADATIIFIEE